MSQAKLQQLRVWLAEQKLDALLVTQAQNRSYLSGWLEDDPNAGLLVVGLEKCFLLTDSRFQEVAAQAAPDWEVVTASEYFVPVAQLIQQGQWKRIGCESSDLSYARYTRFVEEAGASVEFVPYAKSYVEIQRLVKEPQEIDLLRHAVGITDQTFAHLCTWIQPGMTEREIAWEITRKMLELGADDTAFESIVASGPNGSRPHAHPGGRRVQRGELITLDMGARYKGYCADMTRTICLGEPAETRMVELYEIVLLAMKTCEAGLHAGMTGREADLLTREVLASHDLAEYYIHSTGHGIGLQIHEAPSLSSRTLGQNILPAGAVVTVEPGVYIPGWSGLRIEDSGVITEQGFEVLTQSPTNLVVQR